MLWHHHSMKTPSQTAVTVSVPHYPTAAAKCADLVVHIAGLVLAVVFGTVLIVLAAQSHNAGRIAAIGIYAAGIVAMLSFSTAYNFAKAHWRPRLRKLDHAGIFLMIAASYTPFTTQRLEGAWAIGMTAAVWGLALFGVFGKLFLSRLSKTFWTAFYIALGWVAVVAIQPLLEGVGWLAMLLLAIGGLLYTTGVIFHLNKSLTYAKAIWHGHVVAAAGVHWAAVLLGVVLASG